MLEKMPAEYKGKEKKQTEFTKTSPREWTTKEIEWVKEKHNQGYSVKEIAITFGEIGHKRWKRLDYVSKMYGINSLDDFTTDNLIKGAEKIALRHNKKLIVFNKCEWRNISRVWFKIETVEKQETRVKENKKE